jgi:RNA polymerase II subunit A small phosphatase-like protein
MSSGSTQAAITVGMPPPAATTEFAKRFRTQNTDSTFQTVVFSRKTTVHPPDGEVTPAFKKAADDDNNTISPLATLVHQTDRNGKHTTPATTGLKIRPVDRRSSAGISKLFANICSCLGLNETQQLAQISTLKAAAAAEKEQETRKVQELKKRVILPKPVPEDVGKKCLVLDLDETLVHSSFKPTANPDYIIPVEIEGHVHQVYVCKRPGVDDFMRDMAKHYEIVIYTASLSKYADPLLDQLDIHKVIRYRLFREHCVHYEGSYVKDLSLLDRDISQTIIIDNSPNSYLFHPRNAIACSSFIDDMEDRELFSINSFLTKISGVEDVRAHVNLWTPETHC